MIKQALYFISALIVVLTLSFFINERVYAHGTMETPVSRIYNCFLEGPESPKSDACRAAVAEGGTQALYDWNGVNQGNANDMHVDIIPDGELCGGGKELFKGLNLARDDWRSSSIAPDQNGNFEFVFIATAPHSTDYFKFYITKEGHNPLHPLSWNDLEDLPFCTINEVTLQNGRYKLNCPLPQNKSGKHVIYSIWQRDDSPEAFYTCMDVEFVGGVPGVYKSIGQVRSQGDLSVDDKVTFRLFDSGGSDAETFSVVLKDGQTSADDWPFSLANEVNDNSSVVKIGILDVNGNIDPVKSSQDNNVYIPTEDSYTFQVDIDMADNSGGDGDGAGGDCHCECPVPGTNPDTDFIYPNGIGSYQAGTVVLGTDNELYECRPFPNSGWCNGSAFYYAPATGLAWEDAWTILE